MSILIVYATKYGCTEKCAKKLSEKLNEEVELCNLNKAKKSNFSDYDKIIIGGSIYIGKIQKQVSEFCQKNLEALKHKKIGLFICGMNADGVDTQIRSFYPEELIKNAVIAENFGGEFIFSKMNFLEKVIVKKVSKIDKDTSNILEDNIDKLAEKMNIA